jgi:hypothetical protein
MVVELSISGLEKKTGHKEMALVFMRGLGEKGEPSLLWGTFVVTCIFSM